MTQKIIHQMKSTPGAVVVTVSEKTPVHPVVDKAMMIGGTNTNGGNGMINRDEAAHLFAIALQAPQGAPFVELGCYRGRSTVVLAAAAQERNATLHVIDTFRYHRFGHSCRNCVHANVVSAGFQPPIFHQHDSTSVPFLYDKVGFLCIDTDHRNEHLRKELMAWLPWLHHNAVIAMHDYNSPDWKDIYEVIDEMLAGWIQIPPVGMMVGYRRK